jgi:hypothetical protein
MRESEICLGRQGGNSPPCPSHRLRVNAGGEPQRGVAPRQLVNSWLQDKTEQQREAERAHLPALAHARGEVERL